MWDEEEGWKTKKDKHERYESRNESTAEGILQSLIVSFIIVQKYVEKNPKYGYHDADLGNFTDLGNFSADNSTSDYLYQLQDVGERDNFGIPILTFMVISALGSLVSGIVGLHKILRKWPLRMEFGDGGNKILLATIVIFGIISRFGAFAIVFIFSTSLQPEGLASTSVALVLLAVIFLSFQLVLCLIPQGFGPRRFWNLFLSFPVHLRPRL